MAGLAGWCISHRRSVLVIWISVAAGLLAASLSLGAHYRTEFRLPGTDSQRAVDLIRKNFPDRRGETELLVVRATAGTLDDPSPRQQVDRLLARVRTVRDVARVISPFDPPSRDAVSADRRTAVALVHFRQETDQIPVRSVKQLMRLANGARNKTLDVGLSGQALENVESNKPGAGEGIALLAAIVVLLIGFGSAAAVGMALASTMLALSVGFGAMSLVSHLLAIPTFATQIATTIGLGVGIDYALLVLARYRNAANSGLGSPAATIEAMRTAGRTVLFAGGTVMLAMLGLYAVGLPFIRGMGLGVVIVVIPTVLAAVTVLPALLGRAGGHLERWRPPGLRSRQLTGRSSGWARWSMRVQRRPVASMCLALGVLALLAAPAFSIRLANAEANTDNRSTATHRAYQLTKSAFGSGYTRPFEVVATLPAGQLGALRAVQAELRRTPDVSAVRPPEVDASGRHAVFTVYAASAPTEVRTSALLHRLRGPVRDALAREGVRISVGGSAAIGLDLSHSISGVVPRVLAVVIGASLILLLFLFRSVVVALKAGLMNLLAISAAFGVVVAVFQWGWATHLIGVDYAGPIEVFLPILLFPTVFGLSMDYEVFLIARIRDEWDATKDNARAVTEGLATTGRVVTAGAAIMVVLFASLVFADARTVKIFGLGLSVAILLDAIVVRSVLLPATMQLLGRLNWWLPHWLDRLLPNVAVEALPDAVHDRQLGCVSVAIATVSQPKSRSW